MHTDDRRTVSGCFLFADHGLTEAAEAILDRCPIRSYRKGELIYSRDCFERAVGVLLSGEAEVLKGRGVVLNTLSAGDSFGVAGLFTENDRYVSDIRAVRPCRVLLLSAPALEQLFAATMPLPLAISGFCPGASASSTRSWTPLPPLPRRGALWCGCWKIWSIPGW